MAYLALTSAGGRNANQNLSSSFIIKRTLFSTIYLAIANQCSIIMPKGPSWRICDWHDGRLRRRLPLPLPSCPSPRSRRENRMEFLNINRMIAPHSWRSKNILGWQTRLRALMKLHLSKGAWRDIDHSYLVRSNVLLRSRIHKQYGLGSQAIVAIVLTESSFKRKKWNQEVCLYVVGKISIADRCKASSCTVDKSDVVH